MELIGNYIMTYIETGGLLAPFLFISFHMLRPLLFVPVVFMCMTGGILFGALTGTLYSVIGMTLSSVLFYFIILWMPKTFQKFTRLKAKMIGKHISLSTFQITLLKLMPFMHFHMLSLCLIEKSNGFREYTKASFLSSIPLAFIYTSFGHWISNISPLYMLIVFIGLLCFVYLLRKKEIYIKWRDFFQVST